MEPRNKLEWNDSYSVHVAEIDAQHKLLFKTINELIDAINSQSVAIQLTSIIGTLVEYKKNHFATEERYFKEFNYEGAEEHMAQHKLFTEKVDALNKEFGADTTTFAFKLIDFLEDWLIGHLMTADQKYVECFQSHGLK